MADGAPSTVQMYDAQTGAALDVPAGDAAALLRSGRAGFAPDQDVPVVGQDGTLRTMKGAEAASYLGGVAGLTGAGVASPEQVRRQQVEEEYGGLGGMTAAGLAGAARGLVPFGLTDLALTQSGLVAPSTLKNLEEANPVTSVLSEGAGMIGGVLASGGLGGAAKGATTALGRGALRAAEVAAAPAMALGREVSLAGRALAGEGAMARALTATAAGAAEGALMGVGQAVSRASIDDHALTAEKLVASASHSALLGGALTGGLSVVGSALKAGAGKAAEAGGALAQKVAGTEARLAGELAAAAPKTEATARTLANRVEREMTLKATGANQGQIQKLQEMGEAIEGRAIRMYQEEIAGAGKLKSAGEKAVTAEALRETKGKAVRELVDELHAGGARIDTADFVSEQRRRVIDQMVDTVNPDMKRAASAMEDWFEGVEKKIADGDLRKVWKTKSELGNEINWRPDHFDRYNELKKDFYFALDRKIAEAGQAAAEQQGSNLAARWANTNAEYRAADWLAKSTAKGAAAETKNRVFGLSEQIGAAVGFLSGGPMGLATAAAGAYANHLIKRHGADVAWQLAQAAGKGELVAQVARTFDSVAGSKVAGLVGVTKGALSGLKPGGGAALLTDKAIKSASPRQDYERRQKELAAFRASPGPRLEAATRGLEGARPEVRAAVQATVQRGVDFLTSKTPQRPAPPAGLPPHLAKQSPPSPDEVSRFQRYARAVDDPLSVLDDAKKGTLSREAIEAVKAVYPSVYEALRSQVNEALLARKKPPSWAEGLQLGILLDLPTSEHLQPDAVRLYQQIQTQAPAAQRPPGAPPAQGAAPSRPMQPPKLASRGDSIGA